MADPDEILEEVGFGAADPPEGSEDTGNEAANSGNIRVYIDGFSTQLTFRRNTAMGVIKVAKRIVEMAKENGWKTSWKNDDSDGSDASGPAYGTGIPPTTVGKMCPIHHVAMEHKYSKAKGKYYDAHYNEDRKPCFGHGYMT